MKKYGLMKNDNKLRSNISGADSSHKSSIQKEVKCIFCLLDHIEVISTVNMHKFFPTKQKKKC